MKQIQLIANKSMMMMIMKGEEEIFKLITGSGIHNESLAFHNIYTTKF
jgi:hypothetical protein